MQMFIPLSCCTYHLTSDSVSPSQNKFPLFLEAHLSQSWSLLSHQDNASKQLLSLPVSLSRCSRSGAVALFSSGWSVSCQLPFQLSSVRLAGPVEVTVTKRCSQSDWVFCLWMCSDVCLGLCVSVGDVQPPGHNPSTVIKEKLLWKCLKGLNPAWNFCCSLRHCC